MKEKKKKIIEYNKIKKNIDIWYIINIIAFFIPFKAFDWGIGAFNYLKQMDEYSFGISMIFLIPAIVFLFGIWMCLLGIASVICEGISINLILKNSNKSIFKIITILEIIVYIIYIFMRLFL